MILVDQFVSIVYHSMSIASACHGMVSSNIMCFIGIPYHSIHNKDIVYVVHSYFGSNRMATLMNSEHGSAPAGGWSRNPRVHGPMAAVGEALATDTVSAAMHLQGRSRRYAGTRSSPTAVAQLQ